MYCRDRQSGGSVCEGVCIGGGSSRLDIAMHSEYQPQEPVQATSKRVCAQALVAFLFSVGRVF
jgi:hypothetical protein